MTSVKSEFVVDDLPDKDVKTQMQKTSSPFNTLRFLFSHVSKPFRTLLGSRYMRIRILRLGIVIIIGIVFMAVGNPSEPKFLNKVSAEYGSVHGGMTFSNAELLQMGESHRQSYFIFSTYEYEFGTIGVRYFGFIFSVFYVESYRKDESAGNKEEVIA